VELPLSLGEPDLGQPGGAVLAEERVLADAEPIGAGVFAREARQGALDLHELAARVSPLLEEIGVDEPRRVVVGTRRERLEQRLGYVRGDLPDAG
jgi:hypothetical protein